MSYKLNEENYKCDCCNSTDIGYYHKDNHNISYLCFNCSFKTPYWQKRHDKKYAISYIKNSIETINKCKDVINKADKKILAMIVAEEL